MSNANIGAIVGAAFGCGWGIVGSRRLPPHFRTLGMIFAVGVSLALIIALVLHPSTLRGTFRGGIYGAAIAFEVVAILAGAIVLRRPALEHFIVPFVGFVVGLHFIGLWKATELPLFLRIATAMCIVCAVAAFLPTSSASGADLRTAVTGLGSAVVLWSSGLFTLLH